MSCSIIFSEVMLSKLLCFSNLQYDACKQSATFCHPMQCQPIQFKFQWFAYLLAITNFWQFFSWKHWQSCFQHCAFMIFRILIAACYEFTLWISVYELTVCMCKFRSRHFRTFRLVEYTDRNMSLYFHFHLRYLRETRKRKKFA